MNRITQWPLMCARARKTSRVALCAATLSVLATIGAGDALASNAKWVLTGNLNTARSYHTATLLPNGKVLVVGGTDTGALDSVELFDPDTGKWNVTGHLSKPRVGHTATRLSNGIVLVAGGSTTNRSPLGLTNTAELYDPVTSKWSLTGSMTTIRSGHTATLLQDGKVLVAGGFGSDNIKTAELYDPATGTWSATGSLSAARYWHTATRLRDGKVLVAGGSDDGDLSYTSSGAELYDPAAGAWSIVENLREASVFHTATLLPNGRVLVTGGYGGGIGGGLTSALSEVFDPATGSWTTMGSLGTRRYGHTATLLPDGEVLVSGGLSTAGSSGPRFTNVKETELFEATSALWTAAGDHKMARAWHTATLLLDGRVLVAGGSVVSPAYATTALGSAELYLSGTINPPGTITPGFTGAWYDPAQGGHGLFVEVLPDNRFSATWFAFNPAGTQQAWFGGVGTYSGNTAIITAAIQPTGGRWIPNFDSNQVVRNAWGSLKFTFTDCNHGRAYFDSVAGYGTGSMALTRLTLPAGMVCGE